MGAPAANTGPEGDFRGCFQETSRSADGQFQNLDVLKTITLTVLALNFFDDSARACSC